VIWETKVIGNDYLCVIWAPQYTHCAILNNFHSVSMRATVETCALLAHFRALRRRHASRCAQTTSAHAHPRQIKTKNCICPLRVFLFCAFVVLFSLFTSVCGLLSLSSLSSSPRFSHHTSLHRARACYQRRLARPRFTSAALEKAKAPTLTRPASGTSGFVTRTSAHAARPKVARISPIFAAEASQHILAGRRGCQDPHVMPAVLIACLLRRRRDATSASQLAWTSRAKTGEVHRSFGVLETRWCAPSSWRGQRGRRPVCHLNHPNTGVAPNARSVHMFPYAPRAS
jgi:hypothetical protein